jgi:hypothetical protein
MLSIENNIVRSHIYQGKYMYSLSQLNKNHWWPASWSTNVTELTSQAIYTNHWPQL